jgi:hypothetical protein
MRAIHGGFAIMAILGAAGPAGAAGGPGTGVLGGQVTLEGPAPALSAVPVGKDRWFCGAWRVPAALRLGPGGAVADALVVPEGGGLPRAAAPARLRLDNRDCEFAPRVQVASVGSRMEVLTSDPILHTAHAWLERRESLFHVALPVFLSRRTVRLDRPGLVTIACDAGHAWMRAFVWVTETRFAAVTDAKGHFRLPGVPAGRYRLRVWHEVLGERTLMVGVAPGEQTSLAVRFGTTPESRGRR